MMDCRCTTASANSLLSHVDTMGVSYASCTGTWGMMMVVIRLNTSLASELGYVSSMILIAIEVITIYNMTNPCHRHLRTDAIIRQENSNRDFIYMY